VSQLSRPYQIALGAILLLAVAWFLALKPGDAVSEPTAAAAPGMTGLGGAVEGAQGAAAASDASAAATQAAAATASAEAPAAPAAAPAGAATAGPATAPAGSSPAARAAAADAEAARKDPSRKVLRWLARGNVAVVVFSSRQAADDKAVRRVLKGLDRRGGRVRVFLADIAAVGSYEAITRGISVLQAPTTLVISPDKRARALVGYVDRAEVQQLVDDVLGAADVELGAGVRKQLSKAARRLCGAGAQACRAHLTTVNDACASGRASANLTGMIEQVAAAKPPAALASAHGLLLVALRAELAGTPTPDAEPALRKAGYAACRVAA
jgi:hypothetical protein